MKAIVLAAGRSTRMNGYKSGFHKSLLEYKGKRIANHIIDSLSDAGISDIVFVINPRDRIIFERYLPSNISYVFQSFPTGAADALYSARHFITNENLFLVGLGDVILKNEDIEKLCENNNFTITSIHVPESRGCSKVINDKKGYITQLKKGYHRDCKVYGGYALADQKFLSVIPRTPIKKDNAEDKDISFAFNQYIQEGNIARELQVSWWKHFTSPKDLDD